MSESTPEEWRPVVGFEGLYEVSDLGRIRSLDRVITIPSRWGGTHAIPHRGRVLSLNLNKSGYLYVHLGRRNARRVHRLVAEAFLDPCPAGMEVRHGPGGKTDNRAANLSYGMHSENQGADRLRDGTDVNGEKCPVAKLTWAKVDEIRRRLPPGISTGPHAGWARDFPTQDELAIEYGVTGSTIGMVVRGRTWRPDARPRVG